MRRILGLLLLALLLSQGVAPLLASGADACEDDGCTPVNCSQACPACACAIDRDRLTSQSASTLPVFEPLRETPHTGHFIPPVFCTRDILHVPKVSLA